MCEHYRLEADYYRDFHCKCGACRNTCCGGWNIAVSMEEYFRLIGMDCSEPLHRRLEAAFVVPEYVSPQHFRVIAPNWYGRCPMQDEQGLCGLQVECGEAVIPEVCRRYPRGVEKAGGRERACCSNSCEAVVELLMAQESFTVRVRATGEAPELTAETGADLAAEQGLSMALLRDRTRPLRARVQAVCAHLGAAGTAQADPQAALRGVRDALEVMRDNSRTLGDVLDALPEYDAPAYAGAAARFEARFPDWERIFENVLLNHMLYQDFPYTDSRLKPEGSVRGLCLAWGMLRLFCVSVCEGTRDDLADRIAGAFHLIEHSPFYYNAGILVTEPLALLAL